MLYAIHAPKTCTSSSISYPRKPLLSFTPYLQGFVCQLHCQNLMGLKWSTLHGSLLDWVTPEIDIMERGTIVKNVMENLDGRREFPRFCIGIGIQPGTMDMKAFLLQKFSVVEREQIDAALEQGVEAVRALNREGFNSRITRFNLGQKYKYHKV